MAFFLKPQPLLILFVALSAVAALELDRAVYRDVDGRYHVRWEGDAYTGAREYIDDATRTLEVTRVSGKM